MNQIDIKKTKEYQEVEFLYSGTLVHGVFHGVEYSAKISWGQDWWIDLDLISFNPKNSPDISFWLSHLDTCTVKDILLDKLYLLPDIVQFQERIEACREIDPDLLDFIFETLESENEPRTR